RFIVPLARNGYSQFRFYSLDGNGSRKNGPLLSRGFRTTRDEYLARRVGKRASPIPPWGCIQPLCGHPVFSTHGRNPFPPRGSCPRTASAIGTTWKPAIRAGNLSDGHSSSRGTEAVQRREDAEGQSVRDAPDVLRHLLPGARAGAEAARARRGGQGLLRAAGR